MKVLFTDLETTDLKALMGRVLCASFVYLGDPLTEPEGPEPYTFRLDDKKYRGRKKTDDSKLVTAIREEWERADMVVTWNGKLFDIPFLNARLSIAGQRPFRAHFNLDLMYYAKGSAQRIGSAKLDNVQKFYGLPESKTPISWEEWNLAGMGEKDAMDNVVEHCEQDVKVLRQVYPHLLPYVATIHR